MPEHKPSPKGILSEVQLDTRFGEEKDERVDNLIKMLSEAGVIFPEEDM